VTDIRHTPVLLEETLRFLAPRKDGELMIDATLGEGGHSEAFLSRFPTLRIIGIDADEVIQRKARERLAPFGGRVNYWSAPGRPISSLPTPPPKKGPTRSSSTWG